MDNKLRLWDPTTGNLKKEFTGGHKSGITHVVLDINGEHVYTSGNDPYVKKWNLETCRITRKLLFL